MTTSRRAPDAQAGRRRRRLLRLGESIAKARAARKLTQREVADAIGRTATAVYDYEAGRREPPGLALIDLTTILGRGILA